MKYEGISSKLIVEHSNGNGIKSTELKNILNLDEGDKKSLKALVNQITSQQHKSIKELHNTYNIKVDGGDLYSGILAEHLDQVLGNLSESHISIRNIKKHQLSDKSVFLLVDLLIRTTRFSAIQVPESISCTKLKDLWLGKELFEYHSEGFCPNINFSEKYKKKWLIISKESFKDFEDQSFYLNLPLQDLTSRSDIIRFLALRGMKPMSITHYIVLSEILFRSLGIEFIDFNLHDANLTNRDNYGVIRKQIKKIRSIVGVNYNQFINDRIIGDIGVYIGKDGNPYMFTNMNLRNKNYIKAGVFSINLYPDWDFKRVNSLLGFRGTF